MFFQPTHASYKTRKLPNFARYSDIGHVPQVLCILKVSSKVREIEGKKRNIMPKNRRDTSFFFKTAIEKMDFWNVFLNAFLFMPRFLVATSYMASSILTAICWRGEELKMRRRRKASLLIDPQLPGRCVVTER